MSFGRDDRGYCLANLEKYLLKRLRNNLDEKLIGSAVSSDISMFPRHLYTSWVTIYTSK
jgi:hypothetical protein